MKRLLLTLICFASTALAQYDTPMEPAIPIDPNTYGTASETAVTVSQWAFDGVDSSTVFSFNGSGWRTVTGGSGFLHAGIHLPAGALMTAVELQACDTDATLDIGADLVRFFASGGVSNVALVGIGVITSGTPGCANFRANFPTPVEVDNATNTYTVRASLAPGGQHALGGMRVFYRLQVSPAPAVATFPNDVPTTHPFFRFIEALAQAGITAGCGPGSFCPDAPVTRGQVAVFLSAALGLHFTP